MRSLIFLAALLGPTVVCAQDKNAQPAGTPSPVALSTPAFELFKLVPGKTEEFIRSVALWDHVSAAGGQPKSQLYLHEDGEGWDVMLFKPPRSKPKPAQEAAMAAKIKELGLTSGPLYFIGLRETMADHAHIVMNGPTLAETWVAELDAQRAEIKKQK